jgi:molecular chaperone DnaK
LKDYGAQLDEAGRKSIEDAITAAKTKLESKEPAEMDAASEALSKASHKLAEAMYSKTRESQQAGGGPQPGADGGSAGPQDGANGGAQGPGGAKDDVVDADFKEVK